MSFMQLASVGEVIASRTLFLANDPNRKVFVRMGKPQPLRPVLVTVVESTTTPVRLVPGSNTPKNALERWVLMCYFPPQRLLVGHGRQSDPRLAAEQGGGLDGVET